MTLSRVLLNDNDRSACAWLRQLVTDGHLEGQVDERPIQQLQPADLADCRQVHLFCGIGGWPLALQWAGWPSDRPVWTGSCPCQPFSAAGKRRGTDDERHLWPEMLRLIRECRPATVFGEQVASAAGRDWLAGVRADLEELGYAVGAADLCAASLGAPHIRQRLFWVANASSKGRKGRGLSKRSAFWSCRQTQPHRVHGWQPVVFSSDCDENGNCPACGIDFADCGCPGPTQDGFEYVERDGRLFARRLGHTNDPGRGQHGGAEPVRPQQPPTQRAGGVGGVANPEGERRAVFIAPHVGQAGGEIDAPANAGDGGGWSPWRQCIVIPCGDGKARRIEPGLAPLVDGFPGRVGLLRGYGNAIVPGLAAIFIQAFLEAEHETVHQVRTDQAVV